jgi:hypothetical protein
MAIRELVSDQTTWAKHRFLLSRGRVVARTIAIYYPVVLAKEPVKKIGGNMFLEVVEPFPSAKEPLLGRFIRS